MIAAGITVIRLRNALCGIGMGVMSIMFDMSMVSMNIVRDFLFQLYSPGLAR